MTTTAANTLRRTRCASMFTVDAIAARSQMSPSRLCEALRALPTRGRCAAVAADAASGAGDEAFAGIVRAVTHRACPPPIQISAGWGAPRGGWYIVRGAAGWPQRDATHTHAGMTRRSALCSIGTDDNKSRGSAAAGAACPPAMLESLSADDQHTVRANACLNPRSGARCDNLRRCPGLEALGVSGFG